jgi:hypothetical protein
MAFDEYLGERINNFMQSKSINFYTKKMMGGLVFMVNNKMCCGIHIDKKIDGSLLMAKIGEKAYEQEIKKEECLPMDFTGRPMRGYIFVKPTGFDSDKELEYWIQKVIDFNYEMYMNNS